MGNKVKITICTPSIRADGLAMVARCLRRQDFNQNFEWLIVSPKDTLVEVEKNLVNYNVPYRLYSDPPKKKGDFYSLNSSWNKIYSKAKGELIVNIVDWIWFEPDTLTRLWNHYKANPRAVITTIGHQYKDEVKGKPERIMWADPRARSDLGTFYEVDPNEMEMCLCSIPRQAILDCGGLDEKFDKYCALSEKEMCARIDMLDYQFYIDQSIEYRALQHGRIGGKEAWDKGYKEGSKYFVKCLKEISEGKRLKVDGLHEALYTNIRTQETSK